MNLSIADYLDSKTGELITDRVNSPEFVAEVTNRISEAVITAVLDKKDLIAEEVKSQYEDVYNIELTIWPDFADNVTFELRIDQKGKRREFIHDRYGDLCVFDDVMDEIISELNGLYADITQDVPYYKWTFSYVEEMEMEFKIYEQTN